MANFKSTQRIDEGTLRLTLDGRIDEDSIFPTVETGDCTSIAIDLNGIKAINSIGIREWLEWIRPIADRTKVVLERCPKSMVFQVNMVDGFLPAKAQVASLYVPYYCEKCDREENFLFHVGEQIKLISGSVEISFKSPKSIMCKKGHGEPCEMEMDVIEAKYFQFLKRG